tara:strand:+ start:117 stop:428 length:312 start_codon:yes stop_codon:yes gene_type:complete
MQYMPEYSTQESYLDYNSNALDLIGKYVLNQVQHNIKTKPSSLMFKNIIPEGKDLLNILDEASMYINYSPAPGYEIGLEKNPNSFMNPDYEISGSIPFDIEGM